MQIRPAALAKSQTHGTYEELRGDLLSCAIRPGQKLKIGEIAETMNVSQGAVREALSRLTAEGLVVAEPQKGFKATPVSVPDLVDLTEARIKIESLCLGRSIELGDVSWEAGLLGCFHALSNTPSAIPGPKGEKLNEVWADLHADFHERLVAACDSPWLLRIRAQLFDQAERYRQMTLIPPQAPRDVPSEHRGILDATIRRDAGLATQLLADHFRTTTQAILRRMGEWTAT
jgi:DNA-binding GntR family transcriptional regulator